MKSFGAYAAIFLTALASCTKEIAPIENGSAQDREEASAGMTEYPGVLNIKLTEKPESTEKLTALLSDVIKVKEVRPRFPDNPKFREQRRKAGLDRWYTVLFEEDTVSTKSEFSISRLPFIEETGRLRNKSVCAFNDPSYKYQWHYWNTAMFSNFVKGCDIRLEDAWKYTTGSEDVIVAVLDEGIRYTHEDLRDNMWVNEAELNGVTGVDDDENGYVDDIHGYNFCYVTGEDGMHGKIVPENLGSHVSGTIAAVNNNGLGGCGIAGGDGVHKGVRIMCCQMMQEKTATQSYPSDDEAAFVYAAENGASICNCSWSGYVSKSILKYFNENAGMKNGEQVGPMAGGIAFFAAGNENTTSGIPASYDEVYSVASIGPNMLKATYSNYGNWVDISAPGGDQERTGNLYWGVLSCTASSDKSYEYYQGTSMACPHVTGVAALAISAFGGKGFTRGDLIELLDKSANTSIYDYNSGYKGKLGKGMVDAGNLMAMVYPASVSDFSLSTNKNVVSVKWVVPRPPFGGVISGFKVKYNDNELTVTSQDIKEGQIMACSIRNLEFNTEYSVSIITLGSEGKDSPSSSVKKIRTARNDPPVISILKGIEITLNRNQNDKLGFQISDPEGEELSIRLEPEAEGVSLEERSSGIVAVNVDGKGVFNSAGAGKYTTELVVSDGYNEVRQAITYTILDYITPKIIKAIPDFTLKSIGEVLEIDIKEYFESEPNPGISVSQTKKIFTSSISGGVVRLKAEKLGETDVRIAISDPYEEGCSQSFKLKIIDGSRRADIFPTVISDSFNVRTSSETPENVQVMMVSQSGAIILNEVRVIGVNKTASINVPSSCPPGVYTVILTFKDGSVFKENVVKI